MRHSWRKTWIHARDRKSLERSSNLRALIHPSTGEVEVEMEAPSIGALGREMGNSLYFYNVINL
jgi:hypothetical protein